jgi:integration host factor subunit alpha
MALTKSNLIEAISATLDLYPTEAKSLLEDLLETMKLTLASGEDLMLSGFGKFHVNDKAPRKGRNPATGEDMTLDKRRVVTFKSSGKLRDQINGINHE